MSTFREYLTKLSKEDEGLNNIKTQDRDEVVNEAENLVEYQCDLSGGDYVEIYLPENASESEIRNKAIEEASNNLKLEEYRKRPIKNRQ